MSDFDREAEREKLRAKYERDKEKREASERMSELLLQGATMTNRHCPECHSPVFRYEGRQFCPTCEKEITEEGEVAEESDARSDSDADTDTGSDADRTEPSGSDGEDAEGAETSSPADETTAESGSPASEASAHRTPTPAGERRPARVQPPTPRGEHAPDRRTEEAAGDDRRDADRRTEADGEFRDAEASLRREIGSLTRRAEETRDVGRKRDLLAAAREAAETLQAIRRL
jgi:uncharacterized Zn finger protein (UPF0148 family)